MSAGPTPRQSDDGGTFVVNSLLASSRKPYVEVHNGSLRRRAISATAIGAILASLVTILLTVATCLYPMIKETSMGAPQRRLAGRNWWRERSGVPSWLLCDEVLSSDEESSEGPPPPGGTAPRKRARQGLEVGTGGSLLEDDGLETKRFRPIQPDSTSSPQGSPLTESGQDLTSEGPEEPFTLFLEESFSGDEGHSGTQQPSPQPPDTVDDSVETAADQTGGADCSKGSESSGKGGSGSGGSVSPQEEVSPPSPSALPVEGTVQPSDGSEKHSSTQQPSPQPPETVNNSVKTGPDQTQGGAECAEDSDSSSKDGSGGGGSVSPQKEVSSPSSSARPVERTAEGGDGSAKSRTGKPPKHQSAG